MRGGPPSHLGGPGDLPRENLESRSTREAFLSLFFGESFRFQT